MKRIVIATHGSLAEGFKDTIEIVCGPKDNVHAMCFYNGNHKESDIDDLFDRLEDNEQLIVCTDIQFGSVNQNFVKEAIKRKNSNVIILSGINLPLLMEIVLNPDDLSMENIREYIEKSKKQILQTEWSNRLNFNNEESLF